MFYHYFHPWKSEGISVGFEPMRTSQSSTIINKEKLCNERQEYSTENEGFVPKIATKIENRIRPGIEEFEFRERKSKGRAGSLINAYYTSLGVVS